MDFQKIDAIIENIKKLEDEKTVYLERMEKLEEKKATISELVYKKIKNDYEKKIETLNAELYPLIEELTLLRADVEDELRELKGELSEVNLKKEEIMVRAELGEFSQEKADEMIKALDEENKERFESEKKLEEYASRMDEVLKANMLFEENQGGSGFETNLPQREDIDCVYIEYPDRRFEPNFPQGEDQTVNEGIKDVAPEDIEDTFETKTGIQTGISENVSFDPDGTVFDGQSEAEGKTMMVRQPVLEILNGGSAGKEYRVKLGTTDIGNDSSNDIILTDPGVEFKHAQIVFEPEGFKIYDFNSEKGIFVNGVKVKESILKVGDVITLGSVQLKFKE